jgi:hypothetical protein
VIKKSLSIALNIIKLSWSNGAISSVAVLPLTFIEQLDGAISEDEAYEAYMSYIFTYALDCFKNGDGIEEVALRTGLSRLALKASG